MITLTLGEIAEVTGGTVRHGATTATVSGPATVDSRAVEPGGLFVALPGDRADGHDFADQAVRSGAAAALVTRDVGVPGVVVEDCQVALGRIAAAVVERLPGCTVVGITGSQGKTGTKDLIAQLLGRLGQTVATQGNFNNEIGVPLTLLRATEQTRYLVVEMGARAVGNIADLCRIARPGVGVVLNVGTAHISEFGTRENIARTKGELVEALPEGGTAVLNADDDAVEAMAARGPARVMTFGEARDATVGIRDLVLVGGEPRFTVEYLDQRVPVELPLLGAHQAYNAAAAASVGIALGLDLRDVAEGLAAAESRSAWRMEKHERADGVVVVNDAYNANPDSMCAALHTLASMAERTHPRTVAVLGEMLELGAESAAEHERIGRVAAELGIDLVVAVGPGAGAIHEGVRRHGGAAEQVADPADAVRRLHDRLHPGDLVLVKASRASGLERVAAGLLAPTGHNASGTGEGDEGNDAR